jgi:hypothetical protein
MPSKGAYGTVKIFRRRGLRKRLALQYGKQLLYSLPLCDLSNFTAFGRKS